MSNRVQLNVEVLEPREVPTTIHVFDERGINLLGVAPGPGQDRPVLHNLTGANVRIAQYEPGRVGVDGIDAGWNKFVTAATVYDGDKAVVANNDAVRVRDYPISWQAFSIFCPGNRNFPGRICYRDGRYSGRLPAYGIVSKRRSRHSSGRCHYLSAFQRFR